jgi:hypothetical protein
MSFSIRCRDKFVFLNRKNMISKEELQETTGYDSFLQFKRNCQRSAPSDKFTSLTKYFMIKIK